MDKDEAIFQPLLARLPSLFILTPFASKGEVRYCVGEDSKTTRGSATEGKGCVIIRCDVVMITDIPCKILSGAGSGPSVSGVRRSLHIHWRRASGALGTAKCVGRREKWSEGEETEWMGRDEGTPCEVNKVS